MSDVFISYSRKNGDFARRLVDALQAAGRDSWIDWEDIPRTAQWWQEIQEGIDGADTFVCILTPESLGSSACTLEIAHAFANSKRIIPVVHIKPDAAAAFGRVAAVPIDDVLAKMLAERDLLMVARENWQRLGEINWVFFREEDDFDTALKQLTETLETDLPHVKTHTRLLTRAKEWDKTPDDASLLLSGDSLRAAENWLEFNADKNPPPTDLHRRYIETSKAKREQDADAERERQGERLRLAEDKAAAEERARVAETARATRARRAAILAGVIGVVAAVAFVVTAIYADRTSREVAFIGLEFDRFSTLNAANVLVPPRTQTPGVFEPTLTAIAALNAWTPVTKDFDGVPMVEVPAGCFFMGSTLYPDTQPIEQQCFDAPFWIGQTEVTNVQYRAFMEDGGYDDQSYWTDGGWNWRTENNIGQPKYWTDSTYNAPDQPVVGVTWYEAWAYTAWLSAKLGHEVRLPTEAEWEYAARGPDSFVYPWGNSWDSAKAVTVESGAPAPAPVNRDSSQLGASWVGAQDLSGNVYEWTSSVYQDYPYRAGDGREDLNSTDVRVLRGGSWISNLYLARAVSRHGNVPHVRYDGYGFRVVVSSPISKQP